MKPATWCSPRRTAVNRMLAFNATIGEEAPEVEVVLV
jgi:hypothetical protein